MGNTMKFFTDWLNCEVIYKKYVSRDEVGKITFASDETLSCYIEGKRTLISRNGAEEVISTEKLYINGEDVIAGTITSYDVFVVGGRNRPILSYEPYYDEEGNLDFVVVYL